MDGKMMLKNKNNKGFSLLEVLLAISVMTVLVMGAARIFDDWFKQSVNRKVASETLELQNAAEKFVKLNMDLVMNTMVTAPGAVDELDVADLIDRDFLSEDYRPRNSFSQSLRVLIRRADDNTIGGTAIEVITVGDNLDSRDSRMRDQRLFDAALSGGPKMGLISAADLGVNCCNGNIQSAYGEWSIPLDRFSGLYASRPNIENGGYIASYGRVSMNDADDDLYLYRVEMPDRPELNRMMTNMDMNQLDIFNAGTVVSDNMNVAGTATLDGRETSGFSSPYVLAVSQGFDGVGNLAASPNGDSKGNLFVDGDDNTSSFDLDVRNNASLLNSNGLAQARNANVTTVQNMSSAAFVDMNIRGSGFSANRIVTQATQVTGNANQISILQTSAASVNNLNTGSAVVAVTDVAASNTTLGGDLVSQNNVAIQGNLNTSNVVGTSNVSIRSLNCVNGCPPN
jgi:prepilin-type N-terminal cleavage/methylation domain-containing protein